VTFDEAELDKLEESLRKYTGPWLAPVQAAEAIKLLRADYAVMAQERNYAFLTHLAAIEAWKVRLNEMEAKLAAHSKEHP
jgi:hypothetical protein